MEDEFDLRPYIQSLLKSWYIVLGTVIVAGVAAALISSMLPKIYSAEASVAIVRERTDVSFDTAIATEEDILGSRDVRGRQEALIALVDSNAVAEAVLADITDELEPVERNTGYLRDNIEASNNGDLIIIQFSYHDPILASRITDLWAAAYVRQINAIYGSRTGSNEIIVSQVAEAEATYRSAQAALTDFIGNNQITLLENEIEAQQELLVSYQAARNKIQSNPIDFQVNTRQEVLVNYYADLGNIELWLSDAEALREQVLGDARTNTADLSNALSLIVLHNRIYAGTGESSLIRLQLDITNELLEPVSVEDIDKIITVLESRQIETAEKIESLSISFAGVTPDELSLAADHPINLRIAELNNNLLQIRSELSLQKTQEAELTSERDLAWETFQTLVRRQKELEIAADSMGTEVRLASNSSIPNDPDSPRTLVNILLSVVLGGVFSSAIILFRRWWTA